MRTGDGEEKVMRLATLRSDSPDGRLVVVSSDASRCAPVEGWPTLQVALESWSTAEAALSEAAGRLAVGGGTPLDRAALLAPLPRAWQWLDGSAYPSHGELMDQVLGIAPEKGERPLMYQGVSDRFYGPTDPVPMADEALGIDFEGEFGILTDAVPLGTPAEEAGRHIRLLVQINDWSLRMLAGPEMKTGFGWIQAKPPCSMAPFAITPDELGDYWANYRPGLRLRVDWNGTRFGDAHGGAMAFGFHELVAHAARTRPLVAGTVIGSGTVSNPDYREVGSSCIAERRGIEIVDEGRPSTPFMAYGDHVRMEAHLPSGSTPFGAIDQRVERA